MLVGLQLIISANCLIIIYICTKLLEISSRFSDEADTISILKYRKGHNSVLNVGGVTALVLFTAQHLMMFYLCTRFRQNIFMSSEILSRHEIMTDDGWTDEGTDRRKKDITIWAPQTSGGR